MVKSYRLSPLAEVDLENIWFYTFNHWSIEQADSYYHHLVAVFNGLASGTKKGRPVDVLPHFKKYKQGSHVVYFLENGDYVDIIRILHKNQDVEIANLG